MPHYISNIIYGLHQIQAFSDGWNISSHSLPILAFDGLFVSEVLPVCQHLVPNNGGI